MRRMALWLFLAAQPAAALEMGQPPSVMAEQYGRDTAEMSACGAAPNTLKAYIEGATREIQKRSKRPGDAPNNLALFQRSYQDQAGRFGSGADTASCGDLELRLLPVNR